MCARILNIASVLYRIQVKGLISGVIRYDDILFITFIFCTGLVFIVDSQDTARFDEAKHEFENILKFDEMRNVPVVIFANKQDLPGAQSVSNVAKHFALNELNSSSHPWHIQGCCATTGEGLVEGFQRMASLIKEQRNRNRT